MSEQKYSTIVENNVVTTNTRIIPKGFASIEFTNIGADDATVNGNIPLPVGATWSWINHPNIIIASDMNIRFAGVEASKKVLVQMFYFKPIK